ncbi:MAG: synaptic vesicle VAT-1 family membrane protein [Myxococcota bacterium]
MRSLYITRYGGPEVLKLREEPDPAPGPGEVLIHVARSGLNFADVTARVGLYPDAPKPPMVVGYEVAGTVGALGGGVEGLRVGQRVLAGVRFKGHSNRVVVSACQALAMPELMSFEEAAAIPVNYLTAFHMLFHVASLRPGAKVLVHMASGGVGSAIVQLCRQTEGVELFGTASAAKHDYLRSEGMQHPIDYRTQDYAEVVRKATGGRGVDLVLDPLGGPDWKKGYDLLAPGGHLVAFGWANMVAGERRRLSRLVSQFLRMPRFSPMKLMQDNKSVSGVNLGHLWSELALLRGHMVKLLTLFEKGAIKPHVDQVFPLSQGAQAHRYLQEGKNRGKVVFDTEG